MIRVLILAASVCGVLSQMEQHIACVTPEVFKIDGSKFLGTWNQIERISNADETGDCSTTTFALAPTLTEGTLTNTEVVNRTEKARKGVINLTASDFDQGKFKVTFDDNSTYDYHLLASDFDNYAVLYTCKNRDDDVNVTSHVWAWKLSKAKNLTSASELAINTLFTEKYTALSTAEWRKTKQDGCSVNGSVALVYSPILALTAVMFLFKDVIN